MKIQSFIVFFLLLNHVGNGQVRLDIVPTFHDEAFVLDKNYFHPHHNDSISISKIQFYIGQIKLHTAKSGSISTDEYYLIDVSESKLHILLDVDRNLIFDSISFSLGIDSMTNVNTKMIGDLDPIYGMYWTWQSGYIGFKLEGNSPLCPTRNHAFQYHLGGYLPGQNAHSIVKFRIKNQLNHINLYFPIDEFFDDLSLSETNHIMSPCKQSTVLFQKMAKTFHLGR